MSTSIKRIFIIDDNESFRQLITRHINLILPDAEIEQCDPSIDSEALRDCNWQRFDLVLLDYFLGDALTGLDLLKKWEKLPDFPPVIMLTAAGNEEVAVRAMKSGIHDYISKQNITRERLQKSILEALSAHRRELEHQQSITQNSRSFNKTLFYKKLEEPIQVKAGEPGPVLVLIELDNYEILGEEAGIVTQDNVIRHIAKVAFETFRDSPYQPVITRITDMAVAMLLQTTPDTRLPEDMANLVEALIEDPYEYDGNLIPYTVSIGVVRLQDVKPKVGEIIKCGREACKVVRTRGGNGYYIHEPRTDEPIPARTRPAEKRPAQSTKPPVAAKPAAPPPAREPAPAKYNKPAAEPSPAAGHVNTDDKPASDRDLFDLTLEMPIERTQRKEESPSAAEQAETDFDILQAFDDNRVLQYYQPVMPLSEKASQNAAECFSICVRVVATDGSLIDAEQVITGLKHVQNQKLLDRWMLRETVGRIMQFKQNPEQDYLFIIKISEESFSDANLFKWLQNKLMKQVSSEKPGHSIIIEINAETFLSKSKQIVALMNFLRSTYHFRFAASSFDNLKQLEEVVNTTRFDMVKIPHKLLKELVSNQADANAIPAVITGIKQQDGLIVATFIESAIMLTESINAGADFGMGYFIGEPMERIGEMSQIESFEIT